jgi:hypothetical protein
LKLFPAGELAQLGDAHGLKFMPSVNRCKAISDITSSVFPVRSVVNPSRRRFTHHSYRFAGADCST